MIRTGGVKILKRKINEVINRGDIYWCQPRGTEAYMKRLYVVVSNDIACKYSDTILMCPLTTQKKKELPTHVKVKDINGKTATIKCESVYTIHKRDIMDYVTSLQANELLELNVAIFKALGL